MAAAHSGIGFCACHKKASRIGEPGQSLEIQITAVHDVERTGFWLKKIENSDVVHLAIADEDERGDAAAKIEQRV